MLNPSLKQFKVVFLWAISFYPHNHSTFKFRPRAWIVQDQWASWLSTDEKKQSERERQPEKTEDKFSSPLLSTAFLYAVSLHCCLVLQVFDRHPYLKLWGLPLSQVVQDRSISLDTFQASIYFWGEKEQFISRRESPGPCLSYNFQFHKNLVSNRIIFERSFICLFNRMQILFFTLFKRQQSHNLCRKNYYLLNSFITLKAFFICQGFTVTGQCFSVLSSFKSRGFWWHSLVHLQTIKAHSVITLLRVYQHQHRHRIQSL